MLDDNGYQVSGRQCIAAPSVTSNRQPVHLRIVGHCSGKPDHLIRSGKSGASANACQQLGGASSVWFRIGPSISANYRGIASRRERLHELVGGGGYVGRGERRANIERFGEALDRPMGRARHGAGAQRYNGLGKSHPNNFGKSRRVQHQTRSCERRLETQSLPSRCSGIPQKIRLSHRTTAWTRTPDRPHTSIPNRAPGLPSQRPSPIRLSH